MIGACIKAQAAINYLIRIFNNRSCFFQTFLMILREIGQCSELAQLASKDNNFLIILQTKACLMKQGLIEARVTHLENITQKIKGFIHQKSALNHSPFHEELPDFTASTHNKAKRSLTDWRQLYSKNKNKIIPRHTVYPATADGERIRCSMTGQCNRRKVHSSANRKSSHGEINLKTRQLKYQKHSQSKRETLIEFAFAQKCYQKEVLKDQKNSTSKQKKFYNLSIFDRKKRNYWKVNEYLGSIAGQQRTLDMPVDATADYLKRNNQDVEKSQFKPYNVARIKDFCKINNQKLLTPTEQSKRKSKINLQNGLRYYERA